MAGWGNRTRVPAVDRFMSKVEISDGCWLWTGALTKSGYAVFQFEDYPWRGHRWSYTHFVGPIPDGLVLDHLCRVRRCVRPEHLEAVTLAENIRRGEAGLHERSKTHCPQGHAYDEYNTHRYKGTRRCRTCIKNHNDARYGGQQ